MGYVRGSSGFSAGQAFRSMRPKHAPAPRNAAQPHRRPQALLHACATTRAAPTGSARVQAWAEGRGKVAKPLRDMTPNAALRGKLESEAGPRLAAALQTVKKEERGAALEAVRRECIEAVAAAEVPADEEAEVALRLEVRRARSSPAWFGVPRDCMRAERRDGPMTHLSEILTTFSSSQRMR